MGRQIIGVGDKGAGGAAALPTLEKFAKISHNRAENRPKIGQNFSKQWISYRAAPLNFISPYAHAADSRPSTSHVLPGFSPGTQGTNNLCEA